MKTTVTYPRLPCLRCKKDTRHKRVKGETKMLTGCLTCGMVSVNSEGSA